MGAVVLYLYISVAFYVTLSLLFIFSKTEKPAPEAKGELAWNSDFFLIFPNENEEVASQYIL